MKVSFLFIVLIFTGIGVSAQTTDKALGNVARDTSHSIRICTPSRAQVAVPKPLYVVFANGKEIKRTNDTSFLNLINPNDILTLNLFNDTTTRKKYGNNAIGGVIEIRLKSGKYPKGFNLDSLKRHK